MIKSTTSTIIKWWILQMPTTGSRETFGEAYASNSHAGDTDVLAIDKAGLNTLTLSGGTLGQYNFDKPPYADIEHTRYLDRNLVVIIPG